MRPRFVLMIFGFITAVLSFLALAKNSIPPSILGAAIGQKIESVPASPTLYFVLFLALGIGAVVLSFLERKIIY